MGTAGRPVTVNQGHIFEWIDHQVPAGHSVSMLPYQTVFSDFWIERRGLVGRRVLERVDQPRAVRREELRLDADRHLPRRGAPRDLRTGLIARGAVRLPRLGARRHPRCRSPQDRIGADRNLRSARSRSRGGSAG